MMTREALRQLIDQLSGDDLVAAEAFIQFLAFRRGSPVEPLAPLVDPLLAFLEAAPVDDEELLPGVADADGETWSEYQRGDFLTDSQARHQLLNIKPPDFFPGRA